MLHLSAVHILILLTIALAKLHFFALCTASSLTNKDSNIHNSNLSNLLINYKKYKVHRESNMNIWVTGKDSVGSEVNILRLGLSRGKILHRKPHVFVKPYTPNHGVTHVVEIKAESGTAAANLALMFVRNFICKNLCYKKKPTTVHTFLINDTCIL